MHAGADECSTASSLVLPWVAMAMQALGCASTTAASPHQGPLMGVLPAETFNALLLSKSLRQRMWTDSSMETRQLAGIGPQIAQVWSSAVHSLVDGSPCRQSRSRVLLLPIAVPDHHQHATPLCSAWRRRG